MKYKMLLLLALACAIGVAAIGGTLAGYTDREAFSFSIEPDTQFVSPTSTPQATQTPKPTKKPKKSEAQADAEDTQASSDIAASATPTASPENNG